jgi:hypothetical protein
MLSVYNLYFSIHRPTPKNLPKLGYNAEYSVESQPTFWLTFNGLHGAIPQEIWIFISNAMRTSNPAKYFKNANNRYEWNLLLYTDALSTETA